MRREIGLIGGSSMRNHHGIKQGKSGARACAKVPSVQVPVDDQSALTSSYRSFVAYGGYDEPYAPALQNQETLRTLRNRV